MLLCKCLLVVFARLLPATSTVINLRSVVVDPSILRAKPYRHCKFVHCGAAFTKASECKSSSVVYECFDLFVPLIPTGVWHRNSFQIEQSQIQVFHRSCILTDFRQDLASTRKRQDVAWLQFESPGIVTNGLLKSPCVPCTREPPRVRNRLPNLRDSG